MKKSKISKGKASELASKILENKAQIKRLEAENQEAIQALEGYVQTGGVLVFEASEILIKKNPGQLVWPEGISEVRKESFQMDLPLRATKRSPVPSAMLKILQHESDTEDAARIQAALKKYGVELRESSRIEVKHL
jgi:hypothetical protein